MANDKETIALTPEEAARIRFAFSLEKRYSSRYRQDQNMRTGDDNTSAKTPTKSHAFQKK